MLFLPIVIRITRKHSNISTIMIRNQTISRRILQEVNNTELFNVNYLTFVKRHDQIDTIDVYFDGPAGTIYENQRFHFEANLPQDYPFRPPNVVCKTDVIHPNIYQGGVCMDILKDCWSPAMTIPTLFIQIYSLFHCSDLTYNGNLNLNAMQLHYKSRAQTYMTTWFRRRNAMMYFVGIGVWKNPEEGTDRFPVVTKKNYPMLKTFSLLCYLQTIIQYL